MQSSLYYKVIVPIVLRVLIAASLICVPAQAQVTSCDPSGDLRLDHVVVAVRDLDIAATTFARFGFRLKAGRLHADSLINRHIKFRDGGELELMSLAGRPAGPIAREYADILSYGEGGAYVALGADATISEDAFRQTLDSLGVPYASSGSAGLRFISFGSQSDAAATFFAFGGMPVNDPDSVVSHLNGAESLAEAWVEGGTQLERLLVAFGSRSCGAATLPDGRQGVRWSLANGSLVLLPRRDAVRPRVLGVRLRGAPGAADSLPSATRNPNVIWPIAGFFLILP